MKLKGKRGSVTLILRTGPRPALLFGPYLALIPNREIEGPNARGWTITHIPTGLSILPSCTTGAIVTQKEGRLLIARLLDLDWDPQSVARANGPAARRIAADVKAEMLLT